MEEQAKYEKLAVIERFDQLAMIRNPEIVLQEAKRAAKALTDVIAAKPHKLIFNNMQYLEFEDWQTVARFYGVTVKVVSTAYVEMGSVKGFEARAVALIADGSEISAADSMCLNDEEKWSARPKYKWSFVTKDGELVDEFPGKEKVIWEKDPASGKMRPKKKKHLEGMEPVPLFQLRSMAQTRACAKALRNVLAWVVVLAGYSPTNAEEISSGASLAKQDDDWEQPVPDKKAAKGKAPSADLEKRIEEVKEIMNHPAIQDEMREWFYNTFLEKCKTLKELNLVAARAEKVIKATAEVAEGVGVEITDADLPEGLGEPTEKAS